MGEVLGFPVLVTRGHEEGRNDIISLMVIIWKMLILNYQDDCGTSA